MDSKKMFHKNFNAHYDVPDDYFNELENQFFNKIHKIDKKRYFLFKITAALFLLVIIGYPLKKIFFHSNKDIDNQLIEEIQVNLTDIPDQVIEEYLLMEEGNLETE